MPHTPCLSAERLRAYLRGELPEGEERAAAAHLEDCARCDAAAAALEGLDASFAAGLRRYGPAGSGHRAGAVETLVGSTPAPGAALDSPPGYEIEGELGRGGMG